MLLLYNYDLHLINSVVQKCAALRGCQSDEGGVGRREGKDPPGGYGTAGDNMAKEAETLEEHGDLPKVVWRTLADTALYRSGHTSSLWLRLGQLCNEMSSDSLMYVNGAHVSRLPSRT